MHAASYCGETECVAALIQAGETILNHTITLYGHVWLLIHSDFSMCDNPHACLCVYILYGYIIICKMVSLIEVLSPLNHSCFIPLE